MKTIKPSWRYTTYLYNHINLFTANDINTGYEVDVYVCKCGHNEFIVRDEVIDYHCVKCDNHIFLDTKLSWNDLEYLRKVEKVSIAFEYRYDYQVIDNKVVAASIIKIPHNIDYNNKKVFFKDKIIHQKSLNKEDKEIYSEIPPSRYPTLDKKLSALVNETQDIAKYIKPLLDKKRLLTKPSSIYFFANHLNLSDHEFMRWLNLDILDVKEQYTIESALLYLANNHKAKSVRKAIFSNYEKQFEHYKRFDPSLIYIFTKLFTDPNHLMKLLHTIFPLMTIDKDTYYSFEKFVVFLLQNYTQKQVVVYFEKLQNSAEYILRDTLNNFNYLSSEQKESFEKVKCTPIEIHDIFVKKTLQIRHAKLRDKIIKYGKFNLDMCMKLDDYTIKLPLTGAMLYGWGDIMHNCIASYMHWIEKGDTIIYGFFKGDTMKFAVEIQDNQIRQALGKYNKPISQEENEVLQKWYQLYMEKKTNLKLVSPNIKIETI